MIFARELSDNLASLVKKIDAAAVKNKRSRMASFVVFLSDDENLADKLKAFAKKAKLSNCALTIDSPRGPRGYNIAKDAQVSVMLYRSKTVRANYAYRKGEFNAKAVNEVVSNIPKILKR